MNRGFFDASGKCLVIYSGEGEPPVIEGAVEAVVPPDLGPNTCELVAGQVKAKERVLPTRPPSTGKTMAEEIVELKAEIASLKNKLP